MTGIELLPSQKVTVEMGVQAFASKIKPLFAKKIRRLKKEILSIDLCLKPKMQCVCSPSKSLLWAAHLRSHQNLKPQRLLSKRHLKRKNVHQPRPRKKPNNRKSRKIYHFLKSSKLRLRPHLLVCQEIDKAKRKDESSEISPKRRVTVKNRQKKQIFSDNDQN